MLFEPLQPLYLIIGKKSSGLFSTKPLTLTVNNEILCSLVDYVGSKKMDYNYETEAVRQYTYEVGSQLTNQAWILSPYDTWEKNPFYIGEPQPHPEEENF